MGVWVYWMVSVLREEYNMFIFEGLVVGVNVGWVVGMFLKRMSCWDGIVMNMGVGLIMSIVGGLVILIWLVIG